MSKFSYQGSIDSLAANINTNLSSGLTQNEAKKRLSIFGLNQLAEKPIPSYFSIFLRQFESPLIYVLLAAAIIIMVVGDTLDALIISVILFFNAAIGTIQEGRTHRLLESLRKYLKADALIVRDGKQQIVPVQTLVPGDLLLLQQGERVAADARLVQAHLLMVDESILTGESIGVEKAVSDLAQESSLAHQTNMVFKGTYILSGTGIALVTSTGAATELGKIGALAETIHTEIPLKKDLDFISHVVLIFIILTCISLFAIGIWHGRSWRDLLITLSALFICVVPEGLPVVFTLSLVNGAYQMAKKNVVVKKLQAAEGLGRTTIIVLDKTGTLTKNEMMVSDIYTHNNWYTVTGEGYHPKGALLHNGAIVTSLQDHQSLELMAHAASLLNRTQIKVEPQTGLFLIKGDPTQAALFIFSQKIGLDSAQLRKMYTFVDEIPFQADLRYAADFYLHNNKLIALIICSPEFVMNRASNYTQADRVSLESMLNEGLRVIGAGFKEFDASILKDGPLSDDQLKNMLASDLNFLGFFGLQDTIRPEIERMIDQARTAGFKIVMATGDHKGTALFVAKKVGIYTEKNIVIDGAEFEQMTNQELNLKLPNATVFSRLTPEHKLRLIELYHARGEIVAMTGDGVNDAPSLVAADIGIAMGKIGTEVAKEVADIILLDDSFKTIVDAISYSRHIFTTLRRVILYFFATNLAEVLLILFALSINIAILPLTAVQIFWLNLVTDGFLNVALAFEPNSTQIYKHFSKKQKLVDTELLLKTFYLALPMAVGSLAIFLWYLPISVPLARTMTLITMAMFQWMNAWNCRSQYLTNFQIGFFSNHWLIAATSFVLFLQLLLVYVPFMQRFFHTVPLTLNQWILIFLITSSLVITEETRKLIAQFLEKKEIE
ncbi:MAG TPA: HAD-IC family P-type ATPase [Candidatus Babeliales bacterium]|nr:HAD-IC family P-type ATPase [Candidatus Babeliales bacterium]